MKVRLRAYKSPGCVLLGFDWPDGGQHNDFLGFAIKRAPGYTADGKPQFLFNKLDFKPLAEGAPPKRSDDAPIQKFNWWDGGITDNDRGRSFTYTVTPVLGTGEGHLKLQTGAAASVTVTVPQFRTGKISTYFNRAVVSSQSFRKLENSGAKLERQMDWLANGLEKALPEVLAGTDSFDLVIYHLTDQRWVYPALKAFTGAGSIVYHDKKDDHVSRNALNKAALPARVSQRARTRASSLMHDKFVVRLENGRATAVLMGSTNFTPEAFTVQANLLHVFHSAEMADLYDARARVLKPDPTMAKVTPLARWEPVTDIPGTKIRVFFSPEPNGKRASLDTVVQAVKNAHSSVMFCVFTPTDDPLLTQIFKAGDNGKILYGMVNSIPDPTKPAKPGKKKRKPAKIAVELYNRSRKDRKVLQYAYFTKAQAPRGFLPELSTINTSKYSGGKAPAFPVHIHHKFIIIDGDTAHPTIYTGSANFSANSTNKNDENLVEIKGNEALAHVYVAEFMRIYNHFRARAIWNQEHPPGKKKAKGTAAAERDPLVLKTTRSQWDRGAYKKGTPAYLSRTKLL
jgi:phosphatidylserine/phosphatidylglycerophosphate/cardiolipin synthase-like enzyme